MFKHVGRYRGWIFWPDSARMARFPGGCRPRPPLRCKWAVGWHAFSLMFKSADPLGLARRLMLPLPLSPSPPGLKISSWAVAFVLHPLRNNIIFQVSFSIAIKIDFEPHFGSILAFIGIQKWWFCKGGVPKINIFTFFILKIIWTRFLIDFGLLGAFKKSKNALGELRERTISRFRVPRCFQDPILEPKMTPKTSSRFYFGL